MADSPFIGPTYALKSLPASLQRTINMIPVPVEPGNDRTKWTLKDVPGLTKLEQTETPIPGFTVLLLMHGDEFYFLGNTHHKDNSLYDRDVTSDVDGDYVIADAQAFAGTSIYTPPYVGAGLFVQDTEDLDLRDQEFTLEQWMRTSDNLPPAFNAGDQVIFGFGSWFLVLNATAEALEIREGTAGTLYFEVAPTVILTSSAVYDYPLIGTPRTHVALTRNAAGLARLWWNGVMVGSATWNPPASIDPIEISTHKLDGLHSYPLRYWDKEEIRYSLGCRYTANFTPPVSAFLNP